MANEDIPEHIRLRFRQVADDTCEKSDLDEPERTGKSAEFQKQLGRFWRDGMNNYGLDPEAAGQYALDLFRPDSFVERSRPPVLFRLLFGSGWWPVRVVLMIGAVLTGMAAFFGSDGFRNGRETGWVRLVRNVGRCAIGFIGGLCALAEICVSCGLRQKAPVLWRQVRNLLAGDGIAKFAVPIGLAILLGLLIIQHSDIPETEPTWTTAQPERIIGAESPGSAIIATVEPKLDEVIGGIWPRAREESGEIAPKSSDGSEPAGGIATRSSTPAIGTDATITTSEPKAREAIGGVVSFGTTEGGARELDVTWIPREVGRIWAQTAEDLDLLGSSVPSVHELRGWLRSSSSHSIQALTRLAHPAPIPLSTHDAGGSKPVGRIAGSHYRDALGFYRINPDIGEAKKRPSPPRLFLVGLAPPMGLSKVAPASRGFSEVPPASPRFSAVTRASPGLSAARPAPPGNLSAGRPDPPTGLTAVMVQ